MDDLESHRQRILAGLLLSFARTVTGSAGTFGSFVIILVLNRKGIHNDVHIQTQKMKTKFVQFTFVAAVVALALPARAETMSVPSADKAEYTFEVPSGWKPKADTEDEGVEATSPDEHAYLSAWIAKASDEKALAKDIETTLKDSMKSVDDGTKETTFEQNGTKFIVVSGSGVDKREGSKVKFLVGLFSTGEGQVGVVYADFDADAPAGTMDVLEGILKSIKVKK
jgi:hypothetical protein